ncbi:MAG TPA: HD domain-containing phosphohydrolase [Paucimonas sp.]|nr:HD domain-containing phosphohydrolase [Paucimonas sp.]
MSDVSALLNRQVLDCPPPDVPPSVRQACILCVDDEQNVLASLRRLFHAKGYRVLTADSGAVGLDVLAREPVDLIISDMRMPEMDGAQFLARVRERWPDTIRLLLTGYSDTHSILAAINEGEIYRYITKPWDDHDIVLVVRQSLERQALVAEKQRLEALTRQQNDDLTTLNASLERKVEERTAELLAANEALADTNAKLAEANDALVGANDKLEKNFLTSIKVFTNLIDMRGGRFAGRSRRVADLARKIARRMGLAEREVQEIYVAGLLHDIGKLGLPDALLSKPMQQMSEEELGLYRKHPSFGQHALMPLQDLRGAAIMIRAQHERFNGGGFPDSLSGTQIPLGGRILAVACDYDHLQAGTLAPYKLSPDTAKANILNGAGTLYDPRVVEAFEEVLSGADSADMRDMPVSASELQAGMTLSRDLITHDGLLLLSAGYVLTPRLVEQITDIDQAEGGRMAIHICR